jgi:transposase
VDEKSQIQALDRTAPCLPMLPTTPERRKHDYVRHGTTSLFAAYDLASGSVIAQHYRRHRHQEFLRFLKLIDAIVPKTLGLRLVLDNYATHKNPAIKEWLIKHPRFHLHFTPTSSSWLNPAERWFAELTTRKLRRSAHRRVTELETDIRNWINEWNKDPRPFAWTKSADEILGTLARLLPTHHRLRTRGVPQSFVSKVEPGERRLDVIELRHIAQVLGLTLGDVLKRLEEGERPPG